MAFTNHDFRDMRPDVDGVLKMLSVVAKDFLEVRFKFSEAIDAMRGSLGPSLEPPCDLDMSLRSVDGSTHVLEVSSKPQRSGRSPGWR